MNLLDWLCLSLIGFVGLMGYFRGLLHQLASLLAFAVALLFSSRLAQPLAALASGNDFLSDLHTYYLARVLCGAVLYLALNLLIGFVDGQLRKSGLKQKPMNRMGGMLFGLLKGGLIVIAVFVGLSFVHPDKLTSALPMVEESLAMRSVRKLNPLDHDQMLENLTLLVQQVADPQSSERLHELLKAKGIDAKQRIADIKNRRLMPLLRDKQFLEFLRSEKGLGSDLQKESN